MKTKETNASTVDDPDIDIVNIGGFPSSHNTPRGTKDNPTQTTSHTNTNERKRWEKGSSAWERDGRFAHT